MVLIALAGHVILDSYELVDAVQMVDIQDSVDVVDLVFQQHGVPYEVALEAGGWEVIKRYVEIGAGVSIVTSICLRGFERLAVHPMDEYFPTRSYGVVIRRGKFLSPQAKRFLEMMDGEFFARQTIPPARRPKNFPPYTRRFSSIRKND